MNGVRQEYRGRLSVISAKLDEADGKRLARQYGVIGTPTILLLDSQGNQVSTLQGLLPSSVVEQAVEDLLAQ